MRRNHRKFFSMFVLFVRRSFMRDEICWHTFRFMMRLCSKPGQGHEHYHQDPRHHHVQDPWQHPDQQPVPPQAAVCQGCGDLQLCRGQWWSEVTGQTWWTAWPSCSVMTGTRRWWPCWTLPGLCSGWPRTGLVVRWSPGLGNTWKEVPSLSGDIFLISS